MKNTWRRYKTSKNILSLHRLFFTLALFIAPPVLQSRADNIVEEAIGIQKASKPPAPAISNTTIDKISFKKFAQVFPTEIESLFSDDDFQIEVSDRTFPALPKAGAPLEPAIDENGNLVSHDLPHDGLLFPDPKAPLPDASSSRAGYQILWNMQAAVWSQHYLNYDFTLKYREAGKTIATAQGTATRMYPFLLDSSFSREQLFREKISLTNPRSVAPYTWLTFRMFGKEEDLVWIYSPFIKRERQIVGSLRDEGMFFSDVSASDLLTFSGKPQWFNPRVLEFKEYLAPITVNTKNPDSTDHDCALHPAGTLEQIFSRRLLWKLELTNKDPYSLIGKILLYVDGESYLPLYKFEYTKDAKLTNIVYSQFELVPAPSMPVPYAFHYRMTTAYDVANKKSTELLITSGMVCKHLPEGVTHRNFDPSLLADAVK